MTWWLGDLAGALLFTPLVVLWAQALEESKNAEGWMEALAIFIAATLVAIVAFSPLVPDFAYRGALSFLAILPLLWAALRCGPRDTATVAVILSGVAVWGQRADAGPFSLSDPNESFLLLLAFIISVSVPSLALSAATRIRKVTEDELRASESLMREVNARQTLLLAELSHRVNNTLTVVQSIAVRTLSDQLPNDQAKTKLVNRLRALSRAHGLLVNTSWQGARLLDLVEAETEPFATQVEWDGPDVLLTTRSAQSFGLLVHELTTNSCKYGALSTKEGKVQIEWSLRPEPDESCFRFSWSETNGPAVAPPAHHGFGLSLLERAVDLEHGRKPLIAFDPTGFRFEVQVPADRVVVS
jgi:two-component sensor histidine kinase